jgi:hypothetical protein
MKIPFPKRSFWLVSLIILIAAALSLASFLTFNYASANIRSSAINQIHSNAQTEASDMSNIISQKIEEVITNLQVISASSSIPSQNFTGVDQLLQAAQNSTRESTQAYLWMNATGIPVADSNRTFLSLSKNLSIDAVNQPYFVVPMNTGNIYFATNVTSVISGNHYRDFSSFVYRHGTDKNIRRNIDGVD